MDVNGQAQVPTERGAIQQQRGKGGEKGGRDLESEEEEYKRIVGKMGNRGNTHQYANASLSHFTMEVVRTKTPNTCSFCKHEMYAHQQRKARPLSPCPRPKGSAHAGEGG